MKNLSLIINGVLAIAVGVLFFLHFRDCSKCTSKDTAAKSASPAAGSLIAFVDLDSMQEKYTLYKDKKAELEKRQKDIESNLTASGESLQREAAEFQKKAPTMTQSEGEAAQQRLLEKKDKLEQYRDSQAQQLQADLQKFNNDSYAKIDSILLDYNKDKKYAYILTYQKGGAILYKDNSLDITKDVVELLNKMDGKKK